MPNEIDIDKLFDDAPKDVSPDALNVMDAPLSEEAQKFLKHKLPDEMQKLYAGMLRFTSDWSFILNPTPAVYPLRGKSVAKIFQMMQADPGFQRSEALGRFYQDLGSVILLMNDISATKLVESLKANDLYDKKLFKEMRKKVNSENRM